MPDPSPFDDDAEETPPPPRRKRRPWWRWNIVTLFMLLFLLAWVRELSGMPLNATWLAVFTIFMVWWIGPSLFVERTPTAYAPPGRRSTTRSVMEEPRGMSGGLDCPAPPRRPPLPLHWRGGGLLLTALRRFSIVLMAGGVLYFLATLLSILSQFGPRSYSRFGGASLAWMSILGTLAIPIHIVLVSGILYTLTVIAERLEGRDDER